MLSDYIKYFTEMGVDSFFESEPSAKQAAQTLGSSPAAAHSNPNNDNAPEASNNNSSRAIAESANSMDELKKVIESFNGCGLKQTAARTVFGDGNPSADVLLIGEAPGAQEDIEGIPFCGRSGQLLTNIIKSIGLERSEVFITNAVYWRPPANRRPTASEIEICRPFVERLISLVKPKLIILVGSTAVEALLSSEVSMHDIRSSFYEYKNEYTDAAIKTAVIFHPSYLLRQPFKKKLMWLDMLRLKKAL